MVSDKLKIYFDRDLLIAARMSFKDLDFWYGVGPGNPTSAAQGAGYVQELVARLTKTPITEFNTTTNSTITNSNVTFPLDQPIFVDATHDVIISNSA